MIFFEGGAFTFRGGAVRQHSLHIPKTTTVLARLQIRTKIQGWKPGYLALVSQFRCVETQMSGFSFGLVSRLLKNRLQFRFQFCLRTASVSGFQFWFKFHPRKVFYCEYELFKSSTSWRFYFIMMISSSSDGRVRRAVASEVVDLDIIPSPVKPAKTQKLVFTASLFDA